jgi:hypothetical protein
MSDTYIFTPVDNNDIESKYNKLNEDYINLQTKYKKLKNYVKQKNIVNGGKEITVKPNFVKECCSPYIKNIIQFIHQ